MKTAPFLLASCLALAGTLSAQEGAAPSAAPAAAPAAPAFRGAPSAQDPAAPPAETPTATQPENAPLPASADPTLDLVPLVPGQILPEPTLTPESPTGAASRSRPRVPRAPEPGAPVKSSKTELAEKDLADRIRLRQAQTRAAADPAVQQEWHQADLARTDLQRREALKRYYQLLYSRMARLEPGLEKLIQARRQAAVGRLEQRRLAKTEGLSAEENTRRGIIAEPFTADMF